MSTRISTGAFASIGFFIPVMLFAIFCSPLGSWFQSQTTRDEDKENMMGVHYDLPVSGPYAHPATRYSDKATDSPIGSVRNLWVEDITGRLYFQGIYYGSVQQGDSVRITDTGRVFVNGKERNPK